MAPSYLNIVEFIRQVYQNPADFIPLHAPVFAGNERKYLNECIDSTFVSSVGPFVDRFEEEMAAYTGASKAVVCVNGTNALHLALLLAGVGPDTEVITQPLTFIATGNAIAYTSAHPVFLDVDADTLGLSPDAVRTWLETNGIRKPNPTNGKLETWNRRTGRKLSAMVPMHTFGHPCRIDELQEISHTFGIPLVEDAAESLGSYYKGKHTGTFGLVGVLSFNGNKILTTGGGGMLLFQDVELARQAKHLTTQAKIPHPWEFAHDAIGYNYRMPNLNAALGLAQLEQLPGFLLSKRTIARRYQDFFTSRPDAYPKFVTEPPHCTSNYWLNSILFESRQERDEFLKFSNEKGVMARPAWQLLNELPMFISCETDDLKNALILSDRLVNIPSSVKSY